MILHETASKLSNIFMRYCRDPQGAAKEAEPIIQEIYESLGGCDVCAGRGYNLTGNEYKYCECLRGEQLEKFVDGLNVNN